MQLPNLASDDSMRRVRAFLLNSGYTEEFLLSQFQAPSLHDLLYVYGDARRRMLDHLSQGEGAALMLARLFLRGYTIGEQEFAREADEQFRADLESLGLLETQPGGVRCPFVVYPALGMFVAADRPLYPDGSRGYQGSDYVLSGTEGVCRRYVASLPDTPCRRFLDMGCGSGLAAMANARLADEVWAVDISARSVHFAEFNRRLNGIANMRVLEGDLYDPVQGVTFDRIAANPPFEPPLKQNYVFSIGGEDGEQIVKRLIEGVAAHLEPGGRLYCQVSGTDRAGELLDMRIRSWLGAHHGEYDLALFVRDKLAPRDYAVEQVLADNADSWLLDDWAAFYRKLQAIRVVIGHLVIERHTAPREAFHWRCDLHPDAGVEEMERLMEWETGRRANAGFVSSFFDMRLEAAPDWRVTTEHGPREGALELLDFTLRISFPFDTAIRCHPAVAELLCLCDGRKTVRELREEMMAKGMEPADRSAEQFAGMMAELMAAGFVKAV